MITLISFMTAASNSIEFLHSEKIWRVEDNKEVHYRSEIKNIFNYIYSKVTIFSIYLNITYSQFLKYVTRIANEK